MLVHLIARCSSLSHPVVAIVCRRTYLRPKLTNVRMLNLDAVSELARDTIIYQKDNLNQLRLYQFLAFGNLMFWTYFGLYTITQIRMSATEGDEVKAQYDSVIENKVSSLSRFVHNYHYHIAAGLGVIGYGGLLLVGFFSTRLINTIVVKRGGAEVLLKTSRYVAISKLREVRVPLSHISCKTSRDAKSSFTTIKVKNYPLYFLVDNSGTFYDSFLFDRTIGLRRNLNKV